MPLWHLERIYWPNTFLLLYRTFRVMQFLNKNISPAAPSLSVSLTGSVCLSPSCDWTRPSCRLCASIQPVPGWIAPVKRRSRWSVFAVMVNGGNDSEFENMLMTPLETASPLNLEEAVFPSQHPRTQTHPPGSFTGFPMMLAEISPWRWCKIILSRAIDTMCVWDHTAAVCFFFFF